MGFLPAGSGEAPEEESPREYLERTLVLPSVECGVEEMLKECMVAMEQGEKVEPAFRQTRALNRKAHSLSHATPTIAPTRCVQ